MKGKPEESTKARAVVVGKQYHEAMDQFFSERKIPKRFQVEMALDMFFQKEAPALYKILKKKNPN